VLHYGFLKYVEKILRCICHKCCKLKAQSIRVMTIFIYRQKLSKKNGDMWTKSKIPPNASIRLPKCFKISANAKPLSKKTAAKKEPNNTATPKYPSTSPSETTNSMSLTPNNPRSQESSKDTKSKESLPKSHNTKKPARNLASKSPNPSISSSKHSLCLPHKYDHPSR
jgi:DNA-directed RNA polymerase beta' subunit